jgi:hypothetical protein
MKKTRSLNSAERLNASAFPAPRKGTLKEEESFVNSKLKHSKLENRVGDPSLIVFTPIPYFFLCRGAIASIKPNELRPAPGRGS